MREPHIYTDPVEERNGQGWYRVGIYRVGRVVVVAEARS